MIDVIVISTLKRLDLFQQTLRSWHENAATHARGDTLTVVIDGGIGFEVNKLSGVTFYDHLIVNQYSQGASASRNRGASSIPKYRRGKCVMFCDDDLYFCPGWDATMLRVAEHCTDSIVSGHAHPFNHAEIGLVASEPPEWKYGVPLVISTPHFMMPWEIWDDVGFFCEPGGPGGSEDFDYCMRAKAKGYGFAVSEPHCVLHCGLTSSNGKQIVGYEHMVEQNQKLIERYGLKGVING